MEEKDLEFKMDLRKRIELTVIKKFYSQGFWEISPKRDKIVKETLARSYMCDYCALSVFDRYYDDVMSDVLRQYFKVNRIASHQYVFGDCIYLTQTERIVVNELKKFNKGKSTEELTELARSVESADNKIDMAKFPKSIADSFADATEQEKLWIDKVYSIVLIMIITSYTGRFIRAESDVKKHLSWLVDVRLSQNNYPNPKAFIEKYLDRIYDIAYEKLTEHYTLLPASEE